MKIIENKYCDDDSDYKEMIINASISLCNNMNTRLTRNITITKTMYTLYTMCALQIHTHLHTHTHTHIYIYIYIYIYTGFFISSRKLNEFFT